MPRERRGSAFSNLGTVRVATAGYHGKRFSASKYDSAVGKDMPAWSTSLLHCCDNPEMVLCALTGVGIFAIHGHNQDALNSGGCCFTCCVGALTWGECGRQRRYLRKRLQMKGGEYFCSGWLGDCSETILCLPLTICQEARELEIRSRRKWNWLRGFRGIGEPVHVAFFGEESLELVLVDYKDQPRDVLSAGFYEAGRLQSAEGAGDQSEGDAASVRSGMLEAPARIDSMTRCSALNDLVCYPYDHRSAVPGV